MYGRPMPCVAAVHSMTREQDGQDPSSHIVNSVPIIVTFVSLSPACPLGSLFKEHQGEETRDDAGSPLGSFLSALSASSLLCRSLVLPSSWVETQLKERFCNTD